MPVVARLETRSDESTSGVFKLIGCELFSAVPNTSAVFMDPVTATLPEGTICPGAMVPSWQLRHKLVTPPTVGCVAIFWTVVLVYRLYVCDESVCAHNGVEPPRPE